MSSLADRYDARKPGVDIPEAQKEERQERHEFYGARGALRRTMRTKGIVVPELPWQRTDDQQEAA